MVEGKAVARLETSTEKITMLEEEASVGAYKRGKKWDPNMIEITIEIRQSQKANPSQLERVRYLQLQCLGTRNSYHGSGGEIIDSQSSLRTFDAALLVCH